jgi:hypothetical protein
LNERLRTLDGCLAWWRGVGSDDEEEEKEEEDKESEGGRERERCLILLV